MAVQGSEPTETVIQSIYFKSCDTLNAVTEYFASWSVGQSVLRVINSGLWTMGKCAEWAVPTQNPSGSKKNDANGTSDKLAPLVRPLPWLIFLPVLIILRLIRLSVNLGANLLGLDSVQSTDVVRFIHLIRRRVRALKYMGLRRIRQKQLDRQHEANKASSWRTRFQSILSLRCFNVIHNEVYEQLVVNLDKDPAVAEESGSEADAVSDAEDDALQSSPRHVLHRPSSHGSLTQEVIEEENEDLGYTVTSANSNAESSQPTGKSTPKNSEVNPDVCCEINSNSMDSAVLTSDEYYSPLSSLPTSPEPPGDIPTQAVESPKLQNNCGPPAAVRLDVKEETNFLINSEKNEITHGFQRDF